MEKDLNIENLINKMSQGIVLLEYTSLISGNHNIREVTTNRDIIPKGQRVFNKEWRQGADDSKLLCFDLEFGKWDDIEKDTIIKWKEMEGENFKTKMAKLTDLNWDGNQ